MCCKFLRRGEKEGKLTYPYEHRARVPPALHTGLIGRGGLGYAVTMPCLRRLLVLVLCGCLALTSAQYNFGFGNGYIGSFGGGFTGLSARDPRANTGPVVFPPSPPGDPSQTSGVVPGASGFGFQPPGAQGNQYGR
ncbi:unnamed protein product [Pieris macdunnoughi]|uniref:Uncharacterized protein n=1 Tax=Pieris macdunnoughi TaxID=345717 RepID=A0A821R171_9NEOP|nr:unnamed protein product [Pieris macdunnoughi]